MNRSITVPTSDLRVSKDPEVELVTFSLGSCIGVAIWDPIAHVGGMLHFMLGESALAPAKAATKPGMFADTGLPLLFRSVYQLGGVKERLIVKIAGGSAMFDVCKEFDVGRHNYACLQEILARNGVGIDSEHIGGRMSRTMRLHIGTGEVSIANEQMQKVVL